jgi:hypothetical protein
VRAEDKGLAFDVDASADLPAAVRCDARRLRQVLLNLLDNAVKFTDAGRVSLRVRRLADDAPGGPAPEGSVRLCFEVQDSGIGIATDQIEATLRAVRAGRRRAPARGRDRAGPGHQPAAGAPDGQRGERAQHARRGHLFLVRRRAAVRGGRGQPVQGMPHVIGYRGLRRRVLVVDDVAENRALLTNFLGRWVRAERGRERPGGARDGAGDAAGADPDGHGDAGDGRPGGDAQPAPAPGSARHPDHLDVGDRRHSDRAQSLAAGADAFLPKPVDLALLAAEIGRLLDLAWIHDEPAQPTAGEADGRPITAPGPEELQLLHSLAKRGNMSAIHQYAERVATLGEQYGPFCDKLHRMAAGFQTRNIVRFVEQLLDAR